MNKVDSFFAKKSKKKAKPSVFSPDDLAKKLEEAEKREVQRYKKLEEKRKQERYEQLDEEFQSTSKSEADEWKEEVEDEVDLTDLNIQQLDNNQQKNNEEQSEKSVETSVTRTTSGPWSKASIASGAESDDDEETEKQHAAVPVSTGQAAPAPAPAGVYIPLHRRNQMAGLTPGGSSLAPVKLGGRASRKAPDITSDEAFPSLGSTGHCDNANRLASDRNYARSDEGFRQVRHGAGSASADHRPARASLTLGNQFNALRLNDAS